MLRESRQSYSSLARAASVVQVWSHDFLEVKDLRQKRRVHRQRHEQTDG